MKNIKYFYSSFVITFLGIIIGIFLYPNNPLDTIYTILILTILEISLSFDNAVINAKILGEMPQIWQKLFMLIGLPFAVFGMRLVFPILLVSLTSDANFISVIDLALNNPERYQAILESSIPYIYSFGGSFLLMVFLNFFFNENDDDYWIHILENNFLTRKIRQYNNTYIVFVILIGFLVTYCAKSDIKIGVAISYLSGVIIHKAIGVTNSLFNTNISATNVARNGLMGFIYLEIIDASFSLDGVIGAFAISTNIIIIMIGLGIGAMFVRSLTVLFVKQKTLAKYAYLEHGAHYAIGFLAVILLINIFIEIPEYISGSVGILILIISYIHSIIKLKNDIKD